MFLQTGVTNIGSPSLHTPANCCVYVLKFCLCEHCILCALEINSNDGSKQEHVESCPSTTTNISALAQCLWPPILVGSWFTMRGFHSLNHMTLWSCLAGSRGKLKPLCLQYNSIITPLPPNLARWWLTLRGSYSQSPTTLRSGFLVRSSNKLKPLYLHYDSAVPMTIKLDRMVTPTHNVTRPFGHMILKDHMIKESCDFMGSSPSRWATILLSLVAIVNLMVELFGF